MAGRNGQVLAGETRSLTADSIAELIHTQALTRPDHVALQVPGRDCTFRQLWSCATSWAHALTDSGVRRGDLVAVWADRTPDTVAAALAVMLAGAAWVPLEPTHPKGRAEAVIAMARPVLMVCDSRSPLPPPAGLGVAQIDVADLPAGSHRVLDFPRGGDLAYVIFTSGSTGTPKGVMVEHRSLLNYAVWCAATIGHTGMGSPLIGSLAFDLSLTSLWPQLIRGEPVLICAGAWDHATIFGWQPSAFSYIKITPSIIRFLERTKRPDYDRLAALLMIGGEALDTALVRAISERLGSARLMNHYGPTEATVGCCCYEFDARNVPELPTVPIGRPIWNTRVHVVDQNLDRVADGEPGELVVAGLGVARGYLQGDPDGVFIDEADIGGPPGRAYRTGDLVQALPDGALLYLGRLDDQVKVSGHRVELGELRRLALSVEGVADAAFSVVRGDVEVVEAFVVPSGSAQAADGLGSRVRRKLATMLPSAVVPARVHVVPQIAINANGKFDAAATRSQRPAP